MKKRKIDKFFLTVVLILLSLGMAMFVSASLGVFVKDAKVFYSVLFGQIALGLGLGLLGMYFSLRIDYMFWRKYALPLFIGGVVLTSLVYIPGLGRSHGGALRWIDMGTVSFQPVELMKFGFIIYFAAWLSWVKTKVKDFKFGILPFGIILAVVALILLNQPDTKSFILITITGLVMLFISGVPYKHIFGVGFISILLLGSLVLFTPYLKERIKTFIDPSQDAKGSSYQIQQSLIAIGSGSVFGRGYGQSIQKVTYLPEPQGDSIFAVLGEELGFVGTLITVLLYVAFALRGLRIAKNSPDLFSRLLVSGIVILITAQSFMNIASIIGVFPLTGVPLPFMSHGGTSLMIYLVALGIVLQISKFAKVNNS